MTRADAFSNSGTDFETWSQRMVDEGKMWYPEKRSIEIPNPNAQKETIVVRHADGTHSLERRAARLKLSNIACGIQGGNEQMYSVGQDRFCRFERDFMASTIKLMEYTMEELLCNGEACDFYVNLGAAAATVVVGIGVSLSCDDMFEQLREVCRGSGGAAQIISEAPRSEFSEFCGPPICSGSSVATYVGQFTAQFFDRDPGWQCPAPIPERICKKELF